MAGLDRLEDPRLGPSAGGGDPGDDGSDDSGGDDVVCTICKDGQGGCMVYAGDEPDAGGDGAGASDDDADAM
jgi:hypothetical protein